MLSHVLLVGVAITITIVVVFTTIFLKFTSVSFLSHFRFGRSIKIVHFIGSIKPWQHRYLPAVDAVILYPGTYAAQNAAHDYIKRWWQVYSSLEEVCAGVGGCVCMCACVVCTCKCVCVELTSAWDYDILISWRRTL